MDNDAYGHVNNVVYYSYFDTTVNTYLIEKGALDVAKSRVIGFTVETGCRYFAPLTYPETVIAGLRVTHVGRSSIRYEIAIFKQGAETAAAQGHFVHVYVDRDTQRPVKIPPPMLAAIEPIRVPSPPEAP
jgi:acyl-CoA thioester hydrolase